jgi:hypothetical protein
LGFDIGEALTAPRLSKQLHSTRPSATRMARLRERRHRGFRCYSVEVSEADIDALVARGFLDRLRRDDPCAVERAIGGLLDRL